MNRSIFNATNVNLIIPYEITNFNTKKIAIYTKNL